MDLPELSGGGHRRQRLEHLLLEELDALLRDEIADPALEEARISSVELSVDYRLARVRFLLEGGGSLRALEAAERAFARATPFLRGRVAEALDLKFVPALRFLPDRLRPFEGEEPTPGEP